MTSSTKWSAILFLSTLFTIASCQGCGGIIKAGAGVIRSPNYPDGYPASNCVWTIHSDVETHIRIKFKVHDCRGDFLQIYNGNGISGSSLVGEFCNTTPETSIDSDGRVIMITFTSASGARNKRGFVISYESIDEYTGSRVVWSELNPATGKARLNSVPDDLTQMLLLILSDDMYRSYYSSTASGNWTALASHYGQHELMWSNGLQPKAIVKGSMGRNRSADIFYAFTSSEVLGVAVDWLTGNVYWTDTAYDWIIMYNANGTREALIIDEDLDIPTGIAVHPLRGYLFWTDSGSRPKVERSDLAGGSRIELVSTNIIRPCGITIDYETELLYWVDADPSNNRIEVCDLDGANRRTLVHYSSDIGLFDLTISKRLIFATAQETPKLLMLFKDSGRELLDFDLSYTPYSIVTYGPDVQLQEFSPCSSNPCSYLCVGRGPNGYTCLCQSGFLLSADGHTCEDDGNFASLNYLVASETKICAYPVTFPDYMAVMADLFTPTCFSENIFGAVAIAVDVEDGILFFSDKESKSIVMRTLRDGEVVTHVTGGIGVVQDMAVDWVTKHVYWTDVERGTIEVSKYNFSYRTTLIKDNIIKPRSIAIDPERKFLFWTQFDGLSQIERVSLDGTGRVVIKSGLFIIPNGLSIDIKEQRLYYADLLLDTINKIDYFGNNETWILRKNGAIVYDIAVYKDYILWTEVGENAGMYAANRHTGQIELNYRPEGENMLGITTYSDTRQKFINHPCHYQNGGCDQLCLSSSSNERGFVCNCTLGFYLAPNQRSCVSDLVQDNFFLVTDTYRRAIFQVDLMQASFKPKALYLPNIENPIAVSFDPIERKVYWTDVASETLSRASLNGNNYQVIAWDGVEHPDGIAVDSISRLLYWTDTGTDTISVSHLDGSSRKTLFEGLDQPRAIVLHPVEGKMFWTDWGDNPVIERAYMDGTQRSVIVSGSLQWPNGLTIDYDGNRLYWCDGALERLETADFNGNGRRVVLAFERDLHAYDVAVFGQFLYWTDWKLQSVFKVDKDTGRGNVTVGPDDYLRPNGMYIVSSGALPSGDHLCSTNNGGCSSLCLPAGFGRSCACPDGFRFDGDGTACVPDEATECPRVFHNGFIDQSCDPRPGHICNVQCVPGFENIIDAVMCQASGTWDLDVNTICTARQCPPLQTPTHAVPGPCPPPYTTGKMCTHRCREGYTRTGGNPTRLCNIQSEWTGTPLSCEPEVDIPSNCSPDLQFIETPQNAVHSEEDFVNPKCRVNDEEMTVTWHKDGQQLDLGGTNDIIVDQFNDLFIPSFDSRHEGHYACVVFAGDDTECLRAEANLTLNPLSFFSHLPVDAYIDMETVGTVTFMCSPADETWEIMWEKDGEPLEDPFTINRNLVLRDIEEADEGKYTCVVRDPWSRSTGRADAWLFLSDPPQIDISEVCGTITSVMDNTHTTPSPDVSNSKELSSFAGMGQPNDDDINEAEARSSRIVGGAIAEIGSAPYMVQISEFRDREWTNICGGTLLDQQWVLTAAHCMFEEDTLIPIQKENMRLLFGEYDTLAREDSELFRRPAAIIVHEEYSHNARTFDNDIALIRIEPPIRKFTTSIRPICLAPYTLSSRLMGSSVLGRVTGWGRQMYRGPRSRFLKEVTVPFVDRQTCQESVDDDGREFTENMFCAGYYSEQRDACSGDSGGPLAVRYDDGRWYQLGVVSWGIGCAEEGEYGFYTHVSRFLNWLRSKNVTVAYSPEVGVRFNESHGSEVLDFTVRSSSNLTVTTGSTVDLECVPNRDDASVEWFIGNSPEPVYMLMDGVRILPGGLVFRFDAIPEEFAGAYSCVARIDDGEGEQVIRADFQIQVTPA